MVQKKFAAITLLVAAAFVPALAVPMELDALAARREFDNNELFQRALGGFDVRGLEAEDLRKKATPRTTPQATPTMTTPNAIPQATPTPTTTTLATSTQVTPTPTTTTYTLPLATPTQTTS